MSAVVWPLPTSLTIATLGATIADAFTVAQEAQAAQRPLVFVVPAAPLIGQDDPVVAAAAAAVLGMMRACAIEGLRDGWRANLVAGEPGAAATDEAVRVLAGTGTGQVLWTDPSHLGKVPA